MASDIHGVLLVPHEGDPLCLLCEGPCGARPPTAWSRAFADGSVWSGGDSGRPLPHARRALVLAWGGEVVPEGCDRLARSPKMKVVRDGGITLHVRSWLAKGHAYGRPPRWAVGEQSLGTIVLIDADGREVAP